MARNTLAKTVRIADGTAFGVDYVPRGWLPVLWPFVQDVADRVAETGQLDAVLPRARQAFPDAVPFFHLERAETFGLKPEYLFADWRVSRFMAKRPETFSKIELGDDTDGLRSLQRILSVAANGSNDVQEIRRLLTEDELEIFEELLRVGVFVSAPPQPMRFVHPGRSGLYRLQHASLLYRTAASGVLVDPHLHSGLSIPADIGPDDLAGLVDAILVSHFHDDHWSLSTLMMFPRDTPIVVPKVPVSSIICGDMERTLRDCGFTNVHAVDWYSEPLRFGDLEVHVLPFYGEQALRYEHPAHAGVRNWGNSYVVRCADYTSWFLIDSGNDALGTMKEVAHYVKSRFGRIDMLLSNLRRFWIQTPMYINSGLNWLTLSPSQIEAFAGMQDHLITLGPPEVAEICSIVDARYYLPYAHWWGPIGGQGDDEGLKANSPLLVQELADSIAGIGGKTEIVPWAIGDAVLSRGRDFEWVPILTGAATPLA